MSIAGNTEARGKLEKHIVAYADPLSVRAGDALDVFVSCDVPGEYTAELVRLVSGDSRPHGTGFSEVAVAAAFAGAYRGRRQALLTGSYAVLPDLPASEARAFGCYFYPTLLEAAPQTLLHGNGCSVRVSGAGVAVEVGGECIVLTASLPMRRWLRLAVSSGREVVVQIDVLPQGPAELARSWRVARALAAPAEFARGDWELARAAPGVGHYNGRIEALRMYAAAVPVATVLGDLDVSHSAHADLIGAWDFSQRIETDLLIDVSGHRRHGVTRQLPTRAVAGVRWRGDVYNWRDDPTQYGAVHFHDDDLADAQWQSDIQWQVPDDLASGVYAVKLTLGASEDYVPFFVRPAPHHERAQVVYLAATATYLAYANQRFGFSTDIFGPRKPTNPHDLYLLDHPEVGYSLYEYHRDGSGVHFSSRLRPILNLKPKGTPWSFTADTNLTAWLAHIGQRYDVITDEDLHREGADALSPYRVVVTGTHPEYYSTAMLDGLRGWLEHGGRLMYMGGNGFYWRIAYHPENPAIIEVRRAEDGTRAWIAQPGEYYHAFNGEYGGLWRRLGRPPNALVGIGFAAQGFDGGTYYRLRPGATDPRVGFVLDGIDAEEIIGNHGTQGGGAAGEEIDRWDPLLGSPRHAVVIASSENHRPGMLRVKEELHMAIPQRSDPDVRADMTFFETAAGGAVFGTGSISYAGSLSTNGYDNDIARLTYNVLRRFIDPAPFEYPQ
jgi:N,N-dimethylformamidase